MIDPEKYVSKEEALELLGLAMPQEKILELAPVIRGSTNAIYKVRTKEGREYILKISYRDDRNKGKVLEKEARIIQEHQDKNYSIPIPKIIWQGKTKKGWPALLMSHLPGERIEDLIKPGVNTQKAARTLGKFMAEFHQNRHHEINEFETGREPHASFESYARFWLKDWEPLCLEATHVKQEDIATAYKFIHDHLHLFQEKDYPYLHCDFSKQNILGRVEDGELVLTGICDFENAQTGPLEYDIAVADDGVFLFYPEMREHFLEGYKEIASLPPNFDLRMKVVNLFRALRYIKRSVKYNEVHYFDHDREYFETWLKK